jgi:hypothetical protein
MHIDGEYHGSYLMALCMTPREVYIRSGSDGRKRPLFI